MLLYEDTIEKGDKVFDLNRGHGVVTEITEKLFEVDFKSIRVYYGSNGVQKSKVARTLFWSEPYIISPRKDASLTLEINRQFDAILSLIKTLTKN
jgi:hypothetical protein